jgi:hypothetical protein
MWLSFHIAQAMPEMKRLDVDVDVVGHLGVSFFWLGEIGKG